MPQKVIHHRPEERKFQAREDQERKRPPGQRIQKFPIRWLPVPNLGAELEASVQWPAQGKRIQEWRAKMIEDYLQTQDTLRRPTPSGLEDWQRRWWESCWEQHYRQFEEEDSIRKEEIKAIKSAQRQTELDRAKEAASQRLRNLTDDELLEISRNIPSYDTESYRRWNEEWDRRRRYEQEAPPFETKHHDYPPPWAKPKHHHNCLPSDDGAGPKHHHDCLPSDDGAGLKHHYDCPPPVDMAALRHHRK
jgi:hypothetical protein